MADCIFCQITAGKFGTEMMYEDDCLAVFKDLHPQARIHWLIVPKKHYKDIVALSQDTEGQQIFAHLLNVLPKIAALAGIDTTGFRLVNNCGSDAGQTVGHVHFHLLGGEVLPF